MSRPKRRTAAISCVMVSCVLPGDRVVQDRRTHRPPALALQNPGLRDDFGDGLHHAGRILRGRQPPSPIRQHARMERGIGQPVAARCLPARSKVKASAVSRSDKPCKACRTSADPITGAGTEGLPRRDGNRSSIIESGNNRPRCLARKAKALPGANNSPASASTSKNPRWASSRPCIRPVLITSPARPADAPDPPIFQQPPRSRSQQNRGQSLIRALESRSPPQHGLFPSC